MSIRNQVMKAINQKIDDAQKQSDYEIANLRKEKSVSISNAWDTLFVELGRIRSMFKVRKEEVEKRWVNSILSKVL